MAMTLALIALVGAVAAQEPAAVSQVDAAQLPLRLPADLEVATLILQSEDRRDASPALEALTLVPDAAVRGRAALALGRIGLPGSQPRLLELLRDTDAGVRAVAAFGLGRLEYDLVPSIEAALRTRATEALMRHLDEDRAVGVQSALALGAIGAAAGPLRDWLQAAALAPLSKRPASDVVAAGLEAWWHQADAEVAPITPFVGWPSVAVRLTAAHALRRLDLPNGWPLLLRLLDDADADVRLMALKGLQGAPARTAATQATRFLGDRDWRAQCEALNWFAKAWQRQREAPDDDAFLAVLRRSLDRNLHVRRCALGALGAVASLRAVAVDRLLEALVEEEESVRVASLDALVEVGASTTAEALRRFRDRLSFPEAIAPADIGALLEWLEQHPLEGEALARALAAASEEIDASWIMALLAAGPASVRTEALRRVAELDPDGTWRLAQMWMTQEAIPLRAAAATVLADLARRGQGDEQERVALADLLWRQYYDATGLAVTEMRKAMLESLASVDPVLLGRRLTLLLDESDRVLRLRAVRLLARDGAARSQLDRSGESRLPGHETRLGTDGYRQLAARAIELQRRAPTVEVTTVRGVVVLELRADWAPLAVIRFLELVEQGFFADSAFHRVIPGLVAQGGGRREPPWSAPMVRSEESPVDYATGAVGLALSGRDTGAGQFFMTQAPQPHLTGQVPILGRVIEGQRVVGRLQPGDRMQVRVRR